jgi:hypothetical protein
MNNPRKLLPLAASLALLTGCAGTPPPAPIAADQLCRSWTHSRIKKADKLTEETAAGIEARNASRPAWGCEYGEDRAAAKG